ncbi:hypothetical protein M1202_35090 [Streptomyces ardesiacus]|nr:hypothetical protein [Streptomyces ardesiacus]MCL7370594.1 hypothetical protein [Streptomyces ardesiacus]
MISLSPSAGRSAAGTGRSNGEIVVNQPVVRDTSVSSNKSSRPCPSTSTRTRPLPHQAPTADATPVSNASLTRVPNTDGTSRSNARVSASPSTTSTTRPPPTVLRSPVPSSGSARDGVDCPSQ